VGHYDSRFTMPHGEEPVDMLQSDPSWAAVLGPFTAGFNAYVRGELKYESDLRYEVLNRHLRWDWTPAQNSFLNFSDSLRQALLSNRDLRVFVATGYYDLVNPILSTEWTINHLGLFSIKDLLIAAYGLPGKGTVDASALPMRSPRLSTCSSVGDGQEQLMLTPRLCCLWSIASTSRLGRGRFASYIDQRNRSKVEGRQTKSAHLNTSFEQPWPQGVVAYLNSHGNGSECSQRGSGKYCE
jgi:hypothetical protein